MLHIKALNEINLLKLKSNPHLKYKESAIVYNKSFTNTLGVN